jgi:hypothetical protein
METVNLAGETAFIIDHHAFQNLDPAGEPVDRTGQRLDQGGMPGRRRSVVCVR